MSVAGRYVHWDPSEIQGKKKLIYFMVRVVKHWHRLPGEAAESPSLEIIKTRLDKALSDLWQRLLP